MRRTIISTAQGGPGAPYDRASPDACTRHDLQASTLSSRRTTPEKFEERRWRKGHSIWRRLARTRGKGTTPGFEGQAGSYIMAQKGTVGADTSPRSPHSVAHCQSASATSALSSRCRCLVARSPLLATSPQCECYGSLLYPSLPAPPPPVIRPADHALPVLKFRSKSKLQVRVEEGIYHLVPSVQAGTRDHR